METKEIIKKALLHFSDKLRKMTEDDYLLSHCTLTFDEARPLKFVDGEEGGKFEKCGNYTLSLHITVEEEECHQN